MHPANLFSVGGLFALLSSNYNLIPYLIHKSGSFIAEASPGIAFMLANVIVLAILLNSNKPTKAACKRPSSLLNPNRSKSPRLLPVYQQQPSAAKQPSYAPLPAPATPIHETVVPSALQSNKPLYSAQKHEAPQSLPEQAITWKCITGEPFPETPSNSKETLPLDLGHEERSGKQDYAESTQTPSNDVLDKKFEEFINNFFARMRAEVRESTV